MSRGKKDAGEKPAKRRGSAAGVEPRAKSPDRARRAGVQTSHPAIGDGSIDELEQLAVRMQSSVDGVNAEKREQATIKAAAEKELQARKRPRYEAANGHCFTAVVKREVKYSKTPKSAKKKTRKGQAVPQGVAP